MQLNKRERKTRLAWQTLLVLATSSDVMQLNKCEFETRWAWHTLLAES
jgi:hypothetical protein